MLQVLLAINIILWLSVLVYTFKLVPALARRWNSTVVFFCLVVAGSTSYFSYRVATRLQVNELAQKHYYAGIDEKERGNLEQAEQQFEKALSLRPGHPDAAKELSEVRQQNPAEKRVQKKDVAIDPNAVPPPASNPAASSGSGGPAPSGESPPQKTTLKQPPPPPPAPTKGTEGTEPKPARHKPSPFEITHYGLDVELDPPAHRYSATATIRLRSRGETLKSLDFSLSEECKSRSVEMDGKKATFKHVNDLFTVLPEKALSPDREVTIVVRYARSGGALMEDGVGLISAKSVYFLSESRWYPATGELDFRAPVRVRARVPRGYTVVSVGALRKMEKDARSTLFHWETEHFASMVSLTAAKFVEQSLEVPHAAPRTGNLKVSCYTFPEHQNRGQAFLKEAASITRFYEKLYGPYPYEKLGVTEIALFPGGYGTSSFVMLVDRSFAEKKVDREFLGHEIAHQWWGNSVFPQGLGAAWLTEAFSNYSAWMYEASITGNPRVLQKRVAEAVRRYYRGLAEKGDQPIYESDPYLHVGAAEQTIYEKGAVVLHMLRKEIGDKAFMSSLRAFAAEYRFGKAKIADFQKIVDREAGKPMAWFFDQWLGRSGGAALAYSFDTEPDTKQQNQGVLLITQTKPPYRGRLKVVLDVENTVETHQIEISEEHHTFRFPITGKLTNVLIDPDGDMLMPIPKWVVK